MIFLEIMTYFYVKCNFKTLDIYQNPIITIKSKVYLCEKLSPNHFDMNNAIAGFSKLSKEEKINWIATEYFTSPTDAIATIKQYWNNDESLQKLHDEFAKNATLKKELIFSRKLGIFPLKILILHCLTHSFYRVLI